jgi:hypothetical protein
MEPERQFPCLAQFCRSPLFPLPTLECLYIDGGQYFVQCHAKIAPGGGPMARPFSTIYLSEESLPPYGFCTTYRVRLARARWRRNDGSVTHSGECFHRGVPAIGICPRSN